MGRGHVLSSTNVDARHSQYRQVKLEKSEGEGTRKKNIMAVRAAAVRGKIDARPAPAWAESDARRPSIKSTGLAQKLGQLEAAHVDFQSTSWANLKMLGQPCKFYARSTTPPGYRRHSGDGEDETVGKTVLRSGVCAQCAGHAGS